MKTNYRDIYIIKEKTTCYYKIGQSYNYKQRFSNLQSGNPRELKIVDIIKNTAGISDNVFKQKLNKYYLKLGGGTEWYRIPNNDISKIRKQIKDICSK